MAKRNKSKSSSKKTKTISEKPLEHRRKEEMVEPKKTTSSYRSSKKKKREVPNPLVFGKDNYIVMGIGLALILVGFLLMSGGSMPDPDTWDDNIIYSTRRITIAPLVVLIGLGVIVFAIFRSSGSESSSRGAEEENEMETV